MFKFLVLACFFSIPLLALAQSTCFGTTSKGRLEAGVRLPSGGKNFTSYSAIAEAMGRTYVHTSVRDIMLDSYASLYSQLPSKVYKFAETGFEQGGEFSPHKTHQNGLSVDFMVPVMDQKGTSVHLPTHPFNKFGYKIEFDRLGTYKSYSIDFEAMAAHLVSLDKAAKSKGLSIWRVIFDPQLQPYLLKTQYGEYIRENLKLSTKRSWVRHDEHYHVDFDIPCQKF